MAPLTWKNVDAPSLSVAGGLTQGAAESWQNAMQGLSSMFADNRERRQDRASTQALMGAAGITDPEQLKAYLASIDPSKLTPDAALAMSGRMGEVLDYQYRQLQADDLRSDMQQEQYERNRGQKQDRATDAFSALALRAEQMAREGRGDSARELVMEFGKQNPYAQDAVRTALGNIDKVNSEYIGRTADSMLSNLIRDNNSREDAIAQIRDMDVPEEIRQSLFAKINNVEDSRFTAIDTTKGTLDLSQITMPGSNTEVSTALNDGNIESQVARTAISTQLDSDEFEQNQRFLAGMEGVVDFRSHIADTMGIKEDGWFISNVDVELDRIREQVSQKSNGRINISPREAAAVAMQTFKNGTMPGFRGDRSVSVDSAVNLALRLYDPTQQQDLVRRNQEFRNMQNQLDAFEQRIAQKQQELLRFQNGNNPERATQAQESLIQLIQQREMYMRGLREKLMGDAPDDTPGGAVAVGTASGNKISPIPREDGNGGNPITPPAPESGLNANDLQNLGATPRKDWRDDITSRW